MGKQGVLTLLLGVAIGANVVLGCWIVAISLSPSPAIGQTVDSNGGFTVAVGRLQGKGEADALYIWNHADKRLCVYFQNSRTLELLATRNCEYDFKPNQYGEQKPSVKQMKKELGK